MAHMSYGQDSGYYGHFRDGHRVYMGQGSCNGVVSVILASWRNDTSVYRRAYFSAAFFSWRPFLWALFCFSAGKKERSDAYVERKQDPKP